ncbi:MAG TPA: hypothetical protein VLA98_06000, partial [Solirubrobacteraceae bacterium]|nr:hypothetical protein [Solirubrobacteraceae bacterium]
MLVEFDDVRGEVRAGGASATCAPRGRGGDVLLGGPDGPLVGPVTFGERSAAAAAALAAADPRPALCAALRARATRRAGTRSGAVAEALLDCVVLALAGSDDDRAPAFADAALDVLRATGGELGSLLDAPAREVDRLWIAIAGERAGDLSAVAGDDGWTRVV